MEGKLALSDLPIDCRSCFLKCVSGCGTITAQQQESLLWKLFHVALYPPPIWDKAKPQDRQRVLGLV